MTTADMLGNAGPKQTIMLADGNTYTLSKLDQGMQAEFCEGLRARMEEIVDAKAAKYRKKVRDLIDTRDKLREKEEDRATPLAESREIGMRREDIAKEANVLELEARRIVKEFYDEVAAGEYEFYGMAAIRAQSTPSGAYRVTFLMMRPNHPDLTLDIVTQLYQYSEEQTQRLANKVLTVNGKRRDDEKNGQASPAAETPNQTPVSQ